MSLNVSLVVLQLWFAIDGLFLSVWSIAWFVCLSVSCSGVSQGDRRGHGSGCSCGGFLFELCCCVNCGLPCSHCNCSGVEASLFSICSFCTRVRFSVFGMVVPVLFLSAMIGTTLVVALISDLVVLDVLTSSCANRRVIAL